MPKLDDANRSSGEKNTEKPDISERPLRSQSSKHCIVAHYLQWRETEVQLNYKSDPPTKPTYHKIQPSII